MRISDWSSDVCSSDLRARAAVDRQFGAHDLCEQPRDRQPQSDARRRAGVADPFERLENALKIGLGYPDAAIRDLELGHRVAPADGQRGRSRWRLFDGVRDQVDQDMAQPLLVCERSEEKKSELKSL